VAHYERTAVSMPLYVRERTMHVKAKLHVYKFITIRHLLTEEEKQ